MPGDTVTETITFTNSASDCDFVNLYMRAEAHDETANPLSPKVAEKETVAAMTEFLSKLSMKVWNGTELIYDAAPMSWAVWQAINSSEPSAAARQPR